MRTVAARAVCAVCLLAAPMVAWLGWAAPSVSRPLHHFDMCDASAAVAVGPLMFVVANDEDNVLRLYWNDRPGLPLTRWDLDSFLDIDAAFPESDIEGAARIGDRIYWITSHGRNREGDQRANRYCFFGTELVGATGQATLVPWGRPYRNLLGDLLAESRFSRFHFDRAQNKAPKDPGGLNIEGLCPHPAGGLWIGFRNPIPDGFALILHLRNPEEVLQGERARFGDYRLLDLQGRGIRDMAYAEGSYLLIAGSYRGGKDSQLYRWDGASGQPRCEVLDWGNLNPEALVVYPAYGARRVLVLSDDGTRDVEGADCKTLTDPTRKSFRSVWVTLPLGY